MRISKIRQMLVAAAALESKKCSGLPPSNKTLHTADLQKIGSYARVAIPQGSGLSCLLSRSAVRLRRCSKLALEGSSLYV
jgi:hypothetical protein